MVVIGDDLKFARALYNNLGNQNQSNLHVQLTWKKKTNKKNLTISAEQNASPT